MTPSSEKYSAELRFPSGNPYMGFFLTKLPMNNIDRFIVELTVPAGGDPRGAYVTAQKDKLVIVSKTISGLSSASQHYLRLSRSAPTPAQVASAWARRISARIAATKSRFATSPRSR